MKTRCADLGPDQHRRRQARQEGRHHPLPQEAQYKDIYRHIIHKNDRQTKPDMMGMVPDLQLHPEQRQSRQSLGAGSHHPLPQEAPYIDILYIEMILRPSST